MDRIRLQPLTRARVGSLGAAGQAWLAGLPNLLAELEPGHGGTADRDPVDSVELLDDVVGDRLLVDPGLDGAGDQRLIDHR